jgi:putative SOS response-associated peptidase YedK
MCERYVLPEQLATEREFMPAQCWWRFNPSYNVSFPQFVPAIRMHGDRTEGVMMRWGLIPAIAEGKESPNDPPWVGLEMAERSEPYRGPWLNSQRCILPVAGFYVWQLTPEKFRRPFYVRLIDRSVFGFAALWDRSVADEDDVIESCTILTLPANSLMAGIDNAEKRMPAILRRKDYATWLSGTPVRARSALAPYPAEWMEAHAVSPRVNSVKHNDASLIQPVA